ncbi:MAG: hypothetical protein MUD12_01080 [Spirochaetes bacterium]|jgi:hypothetical protein|nr:hypothetical protein [Spirochaetota bacterium]
MKALFLIIILCVIPAVSGFSSQFDELDKPPEGAHEGQIFLGADFSMGAPLGPVIKAEKRYLRGSYYNFWNTGLAKQLLVDHLYFSYGIMFEYMPIDHLGVRLRLKATSVIQRTSFGSNFQNWTKKLYGDYSGLIGPSLHLTTRKNWDIILSPLVGYSFGKYIAAPIAAQLFQIDFLKQTDYLYGSRKRGVKSLAFGTEVCFAFYFSGGFFLSAGFDWTMNMIKFGRGFLFSNPQTKMFYNIRSKPKLHCVGMILTAGYAFYN